LFLISECKQLQENQAVAWISKTKENNPPKQESLVLLERTLHRVGETAENQQKSKVAGSVLVGFLRQKKGLYIPSLAGRYDNPIPTPALGTINI
jgi:hypothetical protein